MVRILSIDRLYSRSRLSARSLDQLAGGGLMEYSLEPRASSGGAGLR